MAGLESFEKLFYGGIAIMAAVVVFLLIFLVIPFCRSAQLGKMLDDEYGDPTLYNRGNVRK